MEKQKIWQLVVPEPLEILESKLHQKLPTLIQAIDEKLVDFRPRLGSFYPHENGRFELKIAFVRILFRGNVWFSDEKNHFPPRVDPWSSPGGAPGTS